jgi:hypothetical protein
VHELRRVSRVPRSRRGRGRGRAGSPLAFWIINDGFQVYVVYSDPGQTFAFATARLWASALTPAQASSTRRTCMPPSTAPRTVAITQQSVATPHTTSVVESPASAFMSGPHFPNVGFANCVARILDANGSTSSSDAAASGFVTNSQSP